MPTIVNLNLNGPSRVSIPISAAHAAIARRIDFDHHAQVKPFAVAPPRDRDGGVTLRIGLLHDELAGALDCSFASDEAIRLGRYFFTFAAAQRVAATSWARLGSESSGATWTVDFLTPTTFRRGNRTSPWAGPEAVAHGLASRWRALHPATAPHLDDRQARGIWISDVRGESSIVQGPTSLVSGFVGRIRYRAEPGTDECAAFGKLLQFAEFAGIGSHTSFGFGQVRVHADRGSVADES